MSRTARSALAASLIVLVAAWPSAAADEKTAAEPIPSPALQALLQASDGGKQVVGEAERAYFSSLPERTRVLLENAVADQRLTSGKHLASLLSLALAPSQFDLVMQDNCVLCHSDPEVHSGTTLFSADPAAVGSPPYMNLRDFVSDVHFRRGLSCSGCHGGDPTEPMGHDFPASWPDSSEKRHSDRSWIPGFCGRCHSDADYMRRFNPGLPTDQLEKYKDSRHGKLLLAQHDSRAAQCVSCHGVHGIQGPQSPHSPVHPKHVPETCAGCHANAKTMAGFTLEDGTPLPTNQYEQYRNSVHGRALLEHGDTGAPACNDCHGNHAAMPPEVASVGQICRTCHSRNGTLFDGSKHKQQFEKHGWPECGKCHGNHAIAKTDDAMLAPGVGALCETCHASYARDNPACDATARYFHEQLTTLASSLETFDADAEQLARRGLDVEPIRDEINQLADDLRTTRSYVHSFERSEFDQAAEPGRVNIRHVEELKAAAVREIRYRVRGLLIATAFISLTIALLWLRLRRTEKNEKS